MGARIEQDHQGIHVVYYDGRHPVGFVLAALVLLVEILVCATVAVASHPLLLIPCLLSLVPTIGLLLWSRNAPRNELRIDTRDVILSRSTMFGAPREERLEPRRVKSSVGRRPDGTAVVVLDPPDRQRIVIPTSTFDEAHLVVSWIRNAAEHAPSHQARGTVADVPAALADRIRRTEDTLRR